MHYFQYNFTVTPPEPGSDILIALLADYGFESFETNENGFVAYIPEAENATLDLSDLAFEDFSYSFESKKIEQVNWNEEWEKNFNPVIVTENCVIRAPFHHLENQPKYDIIIMPKMSFGTGHHDTTWLMSKNMLDFDFKNKHVFDMGCGTGVLAILAHKLGATQIVGNDIDDWSVENALENCSNNNCKDIKIVKGDNDLFSKHNAYDIVLANINKNVLKSYIPKIALTIKSGGYLFLSGFFKTDCDELIALASNHLLSLHKQEHKNEWAVVILKKQ